MDLLPKKLESNLLGDAFLVQSIGNRAMKESILLTNAEAEVRYRLFGLVLILIAILQVAF